MPDRHKSISVLAALAVFSGLAEMASAQVGAGSQLTCNVNVTVTPALRGEGFTEVTGDIAIACTGGATIAPGGAAGAAEEDRELVADEFAAAAGEDKRQAGQARAVLLADAGREPSDAADLRCDGASDCGATRNWVGWRVLQNSTKEKGERGGVNGTRCRRGTCLSWTFGGCGKVLQIEWEETFRAENLQFWIKKRPFDVY